MDNLFVVHQHPVRHRVVVTDDGVHQLVDELVGVEAELLYRPWHHLLQEGRARHVGVRPQPGLEPARDARRPGHAAHAGRQVEHTLALGDGELAEQEERLAGLGGHPVRIAAAGVQVGDGRLHRRLRGHLGEEVLDLEGAEFLVLFELQSVLFECQHSHGFFLVSLDREGAGFTPAA